MKFLPPILRVMSTMVALAVSRGAEPMDRPIAVTSSLEAVLPAALGPLLLEQATVSFLVTVDETGALVDYLALEATHHGLLASAEQTLEKTTFQPAQRDGKPIQSSMQLTLAFYDPAQRAARSGLLAVPFGGSPGDAVQRRVYENTKARFVYRSSLPKELDQPLTITATRMVVLTDAAGVPACGDCVVEFYVDRLGRPRALRVVKSDNETVALSAIMSLRETRFVPPTRHQAPTFVKVRQPFHYTPQPATTDPQTS